MASFFFLVLLILNVLACLPLSESSRALPGRGSGPVHAPPPPQDFDCAVRRLAFDYGAKRVAYSGPSADPTGPLRSLYDALRLQSCAGRAPPLPPPEPWMAETRQAEHQQQHLFVSPDGSDSNPGTLDKPFRTIERARDEIRKASVSSRPATTVFLRKGIYYLAEPFVLSHEDSGSSESSPITYTSFKGEPVMLSGGYPLTNLKWVPYKGGIWRATIDPASYPGLQPFTSLFVNGSRQVRARFPNGNPQDNSGLCFSSTQLPTEGCAGYLSVDAGSSAQLPTPPTIEIDIDKPSRGGQVAGDDHFPKFHYVLAQPGFKAPGFGTVFSFWNNPYSRPSQLQFDSSRWTNQTWTNVGRAVVHMFHDSLWGNWMFNLDHVSTSSKTVFFSRGGWQEARGGSTHPGQHYYVENVLEELDVPGEWYLSYHDDPTQGTWDLFYYPNSTSDTSWQATVVAPQLESVVKLVGTQHSSVRYIVFDRMQFGHTITTYMHPYEVPSGGDWSIHRGGTFFLENAWNVTIRSCLFDQTGGNALFLSNHVKRVQVVLNEFRATGDSAIALVGSSEMIDGTKDTYPSNITIAYNHIHDIGVYGKQTSCFIQSLAAFNEISNNVCYNGPRAGFNFNDGFGGGNKVTENLIFNMVRETEDHGSINTWDRQPYLTVRHSREPSLIPEPSIMGQNFLINGYSGVWALDHDDGSAYYNDTSNFLVYGGCKNYLGHDKACSHNVIAFPSLSILGRRCVSDDNGEFANQYYFGNQCYELDGNFYSWSNCDIKSLSNTVYQTWNNTFYSKDGTFVVDCGDQHLNLSNWQKLGQDGGSMVRQIPPVQDIIKAAVQVLQRF